MVQSAFFPGDEINLNTDLYESARISAQY